MIRIKSLFGSVVLTVTILCQVDAQSFLTNGLVAYYPLNGNANDASGHGNNGTLAGVTFAPDRFGRTNGAASFLGNSDSKITIYSTNLNLAPELTVSAWINFATGAGTFNPRIFSTSGYEIGTQTTAGDRYAFFDNTTLSTAPAANSSNTISAGSWWQIVGVRAGNQLLLYVNGVAVGSTQTTPAPDYSRGFLPTIAENCGNGLDNFAGLINDVRVYNRALSSLEVQLLYAYESGAVCTPHGATASATVVNGFLVGVTLADGGCGYSNTPVVLIYGGGGTGAKATAMVTNGVVLGITVTDAGSGYTATPAIYIYSPLGLQVGLIQAVEPVFSGVLIGTNYQLQVSSDLNTWTNQGAPFIGTNGSMVYPQYFPVDNWNQLFFRLQVAP